MSHKTADVRLETQKQAKDLRRESYKHKSLPGSNLEVLLTVGSIFLILVSVKVMIDPSFSDKKRKRLFSVRQSPPSTLDPFRRTAHIL